MTKTIEELEARVAELEALLKPEPKEEHWSDWAKEEKLVKDPFGIVRDSHGMVAQKEPEVVDVEASRESQLGARFDQKYHGLFPSGSAAWGDARQRFIETGGSDRPQYERDPTGLFRNRAGERMVADEEVSTERMRRQLAAKQAALAEQEWDYDPMDDID